MHSNNAKLSLHYDLRAQTLSQHLCVLAIQLCSSPTQLLLDLVPCLLSGCRDGDSTSVAQLCNHAPTLQSFPLTVPPVSLQDADTEAAPLFGRGDHAAQEQALSVRDRCDLLVRATFLVTVFLPFLLLGPLLLLLAAQFTPTARAQAQAASLTAAPENAGSSEQQVGLCCAALDWAVPCCAALSALRCPVLRCVVLCCAYPTFQFYCSKDCRVSCFCYRQMRHPVNGHSVACSYQLLMQCQCCLRSIKSELLLSSLQTLTAVVQFCHQHCYSEYSPCRSSVHSFTHEPTLLLRVAT